MPIAGHLPLSRVLLLGLVALASAAPPSDAAFWLTRGPSPCGSIVARWASSDAADFSAASFASVSNVGADPPAEAFSDAVASKTTLTDVHIYALELQKLVPGKHYALRIWEGDLRRFTVPACSLPFEDLEGRRDSLVFVGSLGHAATKNVLAATRERLDTVSAAGEANPAPRRAAVSVVFGGDVAGSPLEWVNVQVRTAAIDSRRPFSSPGALPRLCPTNRSTCPRSSARTLWRRSLARTTCRQATSGSSSTRDSRAPSWRWTVRAFLPRARAALGAGLTRLSELSILCTCAPSPLAAAAAGEIPEAQRACIKSTFGVEAQTPPRPGRYSSYASGPFHVITLCTGSPACLSADGATPEVAEAAWLEQVRQACATSLGALPFCIYAALSRHRRSQELACRVDRFVTPFLVVALSSPLYSSQAEVAASEALRSWLEPLLLKSQVDVVLAGGGARSYEVTRPVDRGAVEDCTGIVHVTSGSGGGHTSASDPLPARVPVWADVERASDAEVPGFALLEAVNKTHLTVSQVRHGCCCAAQGRVKCGTTLCL